MPIKKTKTRKVSLPTLNRAAIFEPKSINREARTVDAVFTKGARVLRRGFFQDFFEELSLKKSDVRMGRLESGSAPVLDNHGFTDKPGIRAQIGVIESARLVANKEGRVTMRFSKRKEVEDIFNDIEDGIIRNVSVGYNTFKSEEVGEENGLPIFRAIDWEPAEVSIVAAGADAEAQIRSKEEALVECELVEMERANEPENADETEPKIEEKNMDEPENLDQRSEPPKEIVDIPKNLRQDQSISEVNMTPEEIKKLKDEARKEGIEAENKRQLEIRAIVKKVKLGDELAEGYIKDQKSVEDVRTLVIDALAEKDAAPETETRAANIDASVGDDLGRKGRIEGMTSAILHRYRPQTQETNEGKRKIILPGHELTESGRAFAYLSLVEMARTCLEGNNIRTGGMPKHAVADAVLNNSRSLHSISDFTEILANVANKTLRNGYAAAPKTWAPFTNEVTVADFKQISRTNLGDAPKLEKLEEGSEVKRGSISEAAEKYQVEEFAKIIAISRKVIINDDLAAFTRLPERMGRRAADLESDTVWDIFKANAALADTFALFSSQHGNLSTAPAAPSETGLNEGRAAMRRQTGLDGAEISLIPAWTFVPPAHETAMEKLIATTRPNNASDVNPFGPNGRTTLQMDVEPRLETGAGGSLTSWFISADLGQVDMIELARLEGTNGPQIQSRDGFDVNGMEIKIMHDIGAKAIDFRGLFKNAGA